MSGSVLYKTSSCQLTSFHYCSFNAEHCLTAHVASLTALWILGRERAIRSWCSLMPRDLKHQTGPLQEQTTLNITCSGRSSWSAWPRSPGPKSPSHQRRPTDRRAQLVASRTLGTSPNFLADQRYALHTGPFQGHHFSPARCIIRLL